jgi:hypothetical protein
MPNTEGRILAQGVRVQLDDYQFIQEDLMP